MSRIGMGLVGPGFVAAHHVDAVRRLGDVDIVAVCGSSRESAQRKADLWHIHRVYDKYTDLIADPNIHVVHNTTPNHLHFAVSLAALNAGKHVISDKPLALNVAEAQKLLAAARRARVAHVVTFNYRGHPLIQQARAMIESGDIGAVKFIHGHYLQDWMTDPGVYTWRSDPSRGGASSALADIGSHLCDLIEHVTGLKIEAVLSDFSTIVPIRHASSAPADSFSSSRHGTTAVQVLGEDAASVLLRFEGGVKGSFCVGQVFPGHKNDLQIDVSGTQASLRWQQERQSELWVGSQIRPNHILDQSTSNLLPAAGHYVHLPAGHQQGWSDAFCNVIADAYDWIRQGGAPRKNPPALATFDDGLRSARLIEGMLRSSAADGSWVEIERQQ